MLKDITFGQYYPSNSFVHKMDARVKLVLCLLFMIGIFFVTSFVGFGLITLFLIVAVACSRVPFGSVLRSIKGILFLLIFTAILNIFFTKGDSAPLWSWSPFEGWTIEIYMDGLIFAAKIFLRLCYLVIGTSLLTLTTTPVDLTHAIESLLKPLRVIKFPVHELALLMSLALSFIPGIMEETDRIIRAQKARGADFDTGNIIKRAKAFVPILIPLLIGGFRRADELANAMNSRCYEGAENRTQMRVMHVSWRDFLAGFVTIAVFVAIFVAYAMQEQWAALTWLYY